MSESLNLAKFVTASINLTIKSNFKAILLITENFVLQQKSEIEVRV